ncbi:Elongator subunit elp2 [Geranomyces michiganensis]|nr:Elongator subunit elp2 [Geranomyces michiganensis]
MPSASPAAATCALLVAALLKVFRLCSCPNVTGVALHALVDAHFPRQIEDDDPQVNGSIGENRSGDGVLDEIHVDGASLPEEFTQVIGAAVDSRIAVYDVVGVDESNPVGRRWKRWMEILKQLAAVVANKYITSFGEETAGLAHPHCNANEPKLPFSQRAVAQVAEYADVELQDAAREQIPVDRLHDEANAAVEKDPGSRFHDHLVKALLRWFKHEYFTWVNNPPCAHCTTSSSTTPLGAVNPSSEELAFRCSRVELFRCNTCHRETRFPRYNDPRKLMSTRRGRCGEFANVFALFCISMGFETRYILDFTDHVWTEIYCDGVGWVNCDSCEGEGSYGTPMMYEAGWGKKLSYIFAIGPHEVVDVIKRYTNNMADVRLRRTDVDEGWLRKALVDTTTQLRRGLPESAHLELQKRDEEEQAQLNDTHKSKPGDDVHGRESGSLSWRAARGELGGNLADQSSSETAFMASTSKDESGEKDPKPDTSA